MMDRSIDFLDPASTSTSIWLETFLEDDSASVYSYYSSWSSNYTASNLRGPGRLLGELLSSAGSTLERRLGRLAYRAGLGSYAKAEAALLKSSAILSLFKSKNELQNEEACQTLLAFSRSTNPATQLIAFKKIIDIAVFVPSLRDTIQRYCQKRNCAIDAISFSWKRPGIDYTPLWLFYYNLVSRYLSTHPGSVMDLVEEFHRYRDRRLDFSHFEDALSCCSDVSDTILVTEFMTWHWDGQGIEAYVKRRGFDDPVLHKFAISFLARYEVASQSIQSQLNSRVRFVPPSPTCFLSGMWGSVRALSTEKSNALSEDEAQLDIWTEIYELHCFSYSRLGIKLSSRMNTANRMLGHSWKETCRSELPGYHHAKLRARLMQLEDIFGHAVRKRLPPEPREEYGDIVGT